MGKALVIGLGISGISAAEFLLQKSVEVVGIDNNKNRLHDPKIQELEKKGLKAVHDPDFQSLSGFSSVIISPGVPPKHRLIQEALSKGIEIIGEAELCFRHLKQPCIGITGTNGKTTVTMLVAHVLNENGRKARALGNVGDPLCTYLLHPDPNEIIVAEVSSYQLETMKTPVFDAAVILNVTPDHLDRYPSMKEYAEAKCRIQDCMKKGAKLFIQSQVGSEYKDLLVKDFVTFGQSPSSFLWTNKEAVFREENIEYFLPISYRKMGIHESENALAAWGLVEKFGISKEEFCKSLMTFTKPPHRIEFVKKINGVSFFDDSKGTNIDAVIQAVAAMQGPVVLIAGGVDKGSSYAPWKTFENKIKKIFAIGQAAEKICNELKPSFEVEIVPSLEAAVVKAQKKATSGDCVLLSPGCSSFDMFRDYAHRGEEFKRFVDHLEQEKN